jgi:hypothetical protein
VSDGYAHTKSNRLAFTCSSWLVGEAVSRSAVRSCTPTRAGGRDDMSFTKVLKLLSASKLIVQCIVSLSFGVVGPLGWGGWGNWTSVRTGQLYNLNLERLGLSLTVLWKLLAVWRQLWDILGTSWAAPGFRFLWGCLGKATAG